MMPEAVTAQAFVDDTGRLAMYDKAVFLRRLGETFKGRDVTFTVTPREKRRSVLQNAWLHGPALGVIAAHLGYDAHEHETLKHDLCAVRYGTVAVAPLLDGAPPRIVPSKTTSQLTTHEFSEFMEWLVRFAAEKWGVVLELPDEYWARIGVKPEQVSA